MRINAALLLAVGLAASMVSAHAATGTANITVSVAVVAECTMTANPLAYGAYNSGQNTNLDVSTSISVNCSNGTAYSLALNAGANSNGGYRMTDGASNYLNYNLYSNADRTTSLYNGGTAIAGTGNGNAQTLSIYGRIPAGQMTAVGTFSDTVVGTLSY